MSTKSRQLDARELRILNALLSLGFDGAEKYREQLKTCCVVDEESMGELRFFIDDDAAGRYGKKFETGALPAKGIYLDTGGDAVQIYVMVKDGLLAMFCCDKLNGELVEELPQEADIMIILDNVYVSGPDLTHKYMAIKNGSS